MFLLSKPSNREVERFLASQSKQDFSYPCEYVGSTNVPRGYNTDHNRVQLGSGQATFARAIEAVRRWEIFNIGWLQLCWPHAPIEAGTNVAVLAHHLGFWSINACRIVSVIDEDGARQRCGFIYGTLPDHAERGQEQFTVEWHREDDSVWYDIVAYSRPNLVLSKLGYPVARLLQKRFARDSMAAMVRSARS